ncbi:MAG: hypothetical protein A2544_01730 [Candidatus Zambryskibacteria bacterium RIFOXYD2_FULL_43_10]|uniref:DUF86 domain-containing protein n=1 Tax=Candidatus Zambryskibacteria bacterium RIFOXYD2_FULL_43_10 TaxID=1802782 RepID=A0A1G2V773_9BACT|nr:MAG: hypothetical protein A2544_01730 [Candidatus Zambryskibacteria bacterium RIFOXYD2_FULL_43_10]
MKSEKFHIDFMLDSIRKIEDSVSGIDKELFKNNQEKQSTIILQLMLIGESAKKLSEETRKKIDLPWKQIIGFRDMAIHDYINLNLDNVWNTVENDIPILKKELLNS